MGVQMLQEKCLKSARRIKELEQELQDSEEELLEAVATAEAEEKKGEEHLRLFKATNKELAKVQRELLGAKCDAKVAGGGGGGGKSSGKSKKAEASEGDD